MAIDDYYPIGDEPMVDQDDEGEPIAYVTVLRETDLARLYKLERGFTGRTIWVPKSIEQDRDSHHFVVPRWWADENDLI